MANRSDRIHNAASALLLCVAAGFPAGTPGTAAPVPPAHRGGRLHSGPQVDPGLIQALKAGGQARVLIAFQDSALPAVGAAARRLTIASLQEAVIEGLSPKQFHASRRYRSVPGMAGTVTRDGAARLREIPGVASIRLDATVRATLAESVPALDADIVHNTYGYTGSGVRVAVLDTGVDIAHPDLFDDIAAEHCFTQGGCAPFGSNEGDSAQDEDGHGTHVSGIITSSGAAGPIGFAPDAEIVAVRVLDATGSGPLSDVIAGLDWIISNQEWLNVNAINLSFGTDTLYSGECDAEHPLLAHAFSQLRAMGVAVFAGSGNDGSSTSLAAPACNTGVVAVGATYDSNVGREPDTGTYRSVLGDPFPDCFDDPGGLLTIACFSNSNPMLDIVAPGARIVSSRLGGGTVEMTGTSMAAPIAAAVACLLLEADSALTPFEIETLLETTGTGVIDGKNGLEVPALNALSALSHVAASCVPDFDLGCGQADSWNNADSGATWQINRYPCIDWLESGPEFAYSFTPNISAQVVATLSNMTADLDVFALSDAGQSCDPAACVAHGDATASFCAQAGSSYYLVVDGFNGAFGDYTLSTTCVNWVCFPARAISCGQSHTGNNGSVGSADIIDFYPGVDWDESGPEYVYAFTPASNGLVTASLVNMTADLDIYVLDGAGGQCDPCNRIAHANAQSAFQARSGRTYFLVVEGFEGAIGDYRIDVTCQNEQVFLPLALKR